MEVDAVKRTPVVSQKQIEHADTFAAARGAHNPKAQRRVRQVFGVCGLVLKSGVVVRYDTQMEARFCRHGSRRVP